MENKYSYQKHQQSMTLDGFESLGDFATSFRTNDHSSSISSVDSIFDPSATLLGPDETGDSNECDYLAGKWDLNNDFHNYTFENNHNHHHSHVATLSSTTSSINSDLASLGMGHPASSFDKGSPLGGGDNLLGSHEYIEPVSPLEITKLENEKPPILVRRKSVARKRVKKPLSVAQRKAHNQIEKKYRININSKIASLQKLVPWLSQDGVAFEINTNNLNKASSQSNDTSFKKLNKSEILDMVTEYIMLLQEECKKKDAIIEQLQSTNR